MESVGGRVPARIVVMTIKSGMVTVGKDVWEEMR